VLTLPNQKLILGAGLALVSLIVLGSPEAQARGGWYVHIEARPVLRPWGPPPPPPVVQYVPAPVYAPAPALVAAPLDPPVGISLLGVAQGSGDGRSSASGLGATLQYRTSTHAAMLFELQWVGEPPGSDGLRREDLTGLVGARLYPWNAPLTPYLEVAGGFGEATFSCGCGEKLHTSQLVGRYAVGLELRLSPSWTLEGQLGRIHRLNFAADDPSLASPAEEAIEVHAGLGVRFY
jgi:hypothetical protein